ncbi:MAG: hypothetical protein EXS37_20180 [Opitutus sp.]|nr:hypothetical protein [Opitutus sp.]
MGDPDTRGRADLCGSLRHRDWSRTLIPWTSPPPLKILHHARQILTEYRINLDLDEPLRWREVIDNDTAAAKLLLAEAGAEFANVPWYARLLFSRVYRRLGGLHRQEIHAWAKATDLSVGTVTMLNCAYELSHLPPKLFGCTAGVSWVDALGMVHARALDWPLKSMANATRLFRFFRGTREFVVVGVPGMVGVLSGMVPGAYSVTINWAPPVGLPWFFFGPCFFLRRVLETCDTYDQAVAMLSQRHLATSVFFTVCGTAKGQACVIERTARLAVIRPYTAPALAQANHHSLSSRFAKNNRRLAEFEGGDFQADSLRREQTLTGLLGALGSSCQSPEGVHAALQAAPVRNEETCQQMVFCPAAGTVRKPTD